MGAAAALIVAPLGTGIVEDAGQQGAAETTRVRLIDQDGLGVLWVVSVPVVAAIAGAEGWRLLRAAWPLAASAGVLWAFTAVGILSIGLFFLPAALAMTVAAVRVER